MKRRYPYNVDMLLADEPCAHKSVKKVTFSTTYITYDGVEEWITQGRACSHCGRLLDGSPVEDVTASMMENNLIDLLRKK